MNRVKCIAGLVVLLCLLSWTGKEKTNTSMKADFLPLSAEDEKVFTDVQRQTFQYFWDGAEPYSGLVRERFHVDNVYPQNDKMVVTSGGAGFGVMAILVGIERGFITRIQAVERFER